MAECGGVMGINYCPVFLDDREDLRFYGDVWNK